MSLSDLPLSDADTTHSGRCDYWADPRITDSDPSPAPASTSRGSGLSSDSDPTTTTTTPATSATTAVVTLSSVGSANLAAGNPESSIVDASSATAKGHIDSDDRTGSNDRR
ncbi:hypothetical protein FRC07_007619, partial [Ceratobasidium sp. 392]